MKMNKIISLLLAVLMLAGAFTVLVGAAEATDVRQYEYRTNSTTSLLAPAKDTSDGDEYAYKTGEYILGDNAENRCVSNSVTSFKLYFQSR